MVHSIKDEAEYYEIMEKHPLVMLKFSATWCGPCKQVAPVIDKMAPQYPKVFIGDVDVDENQAVAQINGVTAMPTFIFYKKGEEKHRIMGGDIAGIASNLRSLQSSADGSSSFGSGGNRLGTAQSSAARPDLGALREARLRARSSSANSTINENTTTEKKEAKSNSANNIEKRSSGSINSSFGELMSTLVKYIMLYFASLFTLDSRAAAARYSA